MSYIQTYTGRMFRFDRPEPNSICILDIAHSLSRQCRFNGHTEEHYSVAQHCVIAAERAAREDRLYALMHDAHEAYTGDAAKPMKAFLPQLKRLENRIQSWIYYELGIPKPDELTARRVKRIDDSMLLTEALDCMGEGPIREVRIQEASPYLDGITPWTYEESIERFLSQYCLLRWGGR